MEVRNRRIGRLPLRIAALLCCAVALSGCGELSLRTFIMIRTERGVCVNITTGSDANNGTPQAPKKTIGAAMDYLRNNGITGGVFVAEGEYRYDYSSGNPLTLEEGISLYGGYSSDFTSRDPEHFETVIIDTSVNGGLSSSPNRAVDVPEGVTRSTVIDGFTIKGGGGNISSAVFCRRSSPTISDNRIDAGNGSAETYAVYCYQSGADPLIENNREIRGGESPGGQTHAVYNMSGAAPLIRNNYIHGGNGDNTHGIHNSTNCAATIEGNTIHGGSAANRAYGIFTEYSSPHIWNNTVFGGENASVAANGIAAFHTGTPRIYNNTINSGNSDSGYGIRYGDAPVVPPSGNPCMPDIRNNLVVMSSSGGTCIFAYNSTGEYAVAVENNVLWDPDGSGTTYRFFYVDSTSYQGTTADINSFNSLSWAAQNDSVDPALVDADGTDNDIATLMDNDWHLDSDSPYEVTTGGQSLTDYYMSDKDGQDRTATWSVGAYEFDPF